MDPINSAHHVRQKIGELEEKRRLVEQKLERVEMLKDEGARYYQGTELPIDDVIFSIREGQVRSLKISLDFYKQKLYELNPSDKLALPLAGENGIDVRGVGVKA
ncbi:MAG: hypothetical protein ACYTFG_11825 [Planctomycetota bacterium]